MNINKAIILSVFFIFSCLASEKKSNNEKIQSIYSKQLTEYFQVLVELNKFNGVVFLKKNNEVILYDTFNLVQDSIESLSVNKSDQFDIHSISKLMAKAAVVDLETVNKISKDDTVAEYIPDFPNGDAITIQNLLDNQSGLPRELSYKVDNLIEKTPEQLIELIKQEKLIYQPGSDSSYSNLGYQVLYFIISKISQVPFVDFLNDQYFQPLKMKSTGAHFHLNSVSHEGLVSNHEMDGDKITVVPNVQDSDKNQAKLYSNIEDLSTFLDHIKKPQYFNKLKNQNRNTIGWSGGGDGILSHLEYNIGGDYELVFFSNYDEIPFGDIVLTIEKIMTDKPYDLPKILNRKEKVLSAELLKTYSGKYVMKEFNNSLFEFRIENADLIFYQDGERNTKLNAETDSTFFDHPSDEDYFKFRQTKNGDFEVIYYYKKVPILGERENAM